VNVVREQDDELAGADLDKAFALTTRHDQVTLLVIRLQFEQRDVAVADALGS